MKNLISLPSFNPAIRFLKHLLAKLHISDVILLQFPRNSSLDKAARAEKFLKNRLMNFQHYHFSERLSRWSFLAYFQEATFEIVFG